MKSSILLAVLLLVGCYRDDDRFPVPEQVFVYGAPDGGSCSAACAVLRQLGCRESEPSPGGRTCEDVCKINADRLPVACVSEAHDVVSVRACGVGCR